jgi:hypothetical protein
MITNFEEITAPLSEDEIFVADILSRSLSKVTKSKPATATHIIDKFNNGGIRDHLNLPFKLTEGRLRKIINYIRQNGSIPVLSNAKGYYVSYSKEDIANQITSLNERCDAIKAAADGLKRFLN